MSASCTNDIGFDFHGDNLNAWNIRGGLVNSNRIGLDFDLENGKLQGFTISDGTQLEDNKDAAILVASGIIRGIYLSSVYSELFASERLLKIEPKGKPVRIGLLSLSSSFIYAKDTPPLYVSTRSVDMANVNISSVFLRHSQEQLAIAEAAGSNSSVTSADSISESIKNVSSHAQIVGRNGARTSTAYGGVQDSGH